MAKKNIFTNETKYVSLLVRRPVDWRHVQTNDSQVKKLRHLVWNWRHNAGSVISLRTFLKKFQSYNH